jgi:hypothetical protein
MHDGSKYAIRHRLADILHRPAKPPGAGLVETQRDRRHFGRDAERGQALKGRCERSDVMSNFVGIGENEIAGRNIDGADAAGQTAGPGAGRIDMAYIRSVKEFRDRIVAISFMVPKPEKNVVMAIEYELHLSSCFARTSG